MAIKIMNREQAEGATKAELQATLKSAGIPFKSKNAKPVLIEALMNALDTHKARQSSKKERKLGVAASLCTLFGKVGAQLTEEQLRREFSHVTFDGSVRPWISSLKNPAYTPAGFEGPIDIRRVVQDDGEVVFRRVV